MASGPGGGHSRSACTSEPAKSGVTPFEKTKRRRTGRSGGM